MYALPVTAVRDRVELEAYSRHTGVLMLPDGGVEVTGPDWTVIGSRPTAPPLIIPNALSPPTDIDLNHLLSKLAWEYIILSTRLRDYLEVG